MSATLLAAFAHPDDELLAAAALLAQRARGDRVVLLWLTRGEMTEAFGPLPVEEVAARREEQGRRAAEILGVEPLFLDFQDTLLEATPDAAARVARVLADVRPQGVLTWGDAWLRGMRHPDHRACGEIVRDAVTLARIARVVAPASPHRDVVPVFTLRDAHSALPAVAIDVEPYMDAMLELASFYQQEIGFGDRGWMEAMLTEAGQRWGVRRAVEFDAWETRPGLVPALLPAEPHGPPIHPDRK